MLPVGRIQSQILQTVVSPVFIHVMNNLSRQQGTSDGRFHYQAMFQNTFFPVSSRMIRRVKGYISATGNGPASFPVSMLPAMHRSTIQNLDIVRVAEAPDLLWLNAKMKNADHLSATHLLFGKAADWGEIIVQT